jgi:hypothetical protein
VAHPGAILLRELQLPVKVAAVFVFHRGNPNHTPDRLRTARKVTRQKIEQRHQIHPVRLRAPLPSVHLDAGRVDDEVLDPMRGEEAMQPEAIPARFVAAHHPRIGREPKPLLRPGNLRQKRLSIT